MCLKTIVAICIPLVGALAAIVIALAKYIIRRKENTNRVFWEYLSHMYQPRTKKYTEELTLTIKNISADILKVEKIRYGCGRYYKYSQSPICKPNDDLQIKLIPTIPNFHSKKNVYILYRDGIGYKHKLRITSKYNKSDMNVELSINQ